MASVELKKRIIGSYGNWLVSFYCYARFVIMNMRILDEIEDLQVAGEISTPAEARAWLTLRQAGS